MRATVVEKQEIQAIREGLREGVDEEVKALGVEIGQFEEKALPGGGCHRAIDVEPLEDMLHRPDGLHPTGRETAAPNGQEAEAAFILAEDPDGTQIVSWNSLLEVRLTRRLESRNGLRIFLCDWGAAL
jgi:hypothetical protein